MLHIVGTIQLLMTGLKTLWLGKELNWNVSSDLDWSENFPKNEFMINSEVFKAPEVELAGYEDLSHEKKIEMDRHRVSWNLSQFLHGEQGSITSSISVSVLCANL